VRGAALSTAAMEELAPVMNCNRPHEYQEIYILWPHFEYLAADLCCYFCLFSKEQSCRKLSVAGKKFLVNYSSEQSKGKNRKASKKRRLILSFIWQEFSIKQIENP